MLRRRDRYKVNDTDKAIKYGPGDIRPSPAHIHKKEWGYIEYRLACSQQQTPKTAPDGPGIRQLRGRFPSLRANICVGKLYWWEIMAHILDKLNY